MFKYILFTFLCLLLSSCQKSPEDVVDSFLQSANHHQNTKALTFFDKDSQSLLKDLALYKAQKDKKDSPLKYLFDDFQSRSVEEIILLEENLKEQKSIVELRFLGGETQKFHLIFENKEWKIHINTKK